ncbi:MAG TPA: STAS domain-containing protein [Mycobacteriales bacterium]|jgi:anti-anti-sigma factor|nr:STAS domain-containing protein [Mycobacteriales bacterium]
MRRIISFGPFDPLSLPGSPEPEQVARYDRARAVVVVQGEVDIATVPQLAGALAEALLDEQDLTVDLTAVDFFGVSGLNAVATAARTASRIGRATRVVGTRGTTRRLFEITGFADLLSAGARVSSRAAREDVVTEGS